MFVRELEARLRETDQQLQQLHSWSTSHLVRELPADLGGYSYVIPLPVPQRGVHSDLVQREKERVELYRQKTKAALVIQLTWRRSGVPRYGYDMHSYFLAYLQVHASQTSA